MNLYDQRIKYIESELERFDVLYRNTYDFNWIMNNQLNLCNNKLIEYRQSLIDRICHNSNVVESYKKSLFRQERINSFLQKIYFFINFKIIKIIQYKKKKKNDYSRRKSKRNTNTSRSLSKKVDRV